MRKIFGALALSFAFASQASAATIVESSYGDFGNDEASITDVGSLDEGVNTISGQLSYLPCLIKAIDAVCGAQDLIDAVSFVVPEGFEMVSASIASSGFGPGGYEAGLFDFDTLTPLASGEFLVGDGGAIDDGQVLPSGKYVFAVVGEPFEPVAEVNLAAANVVGVPYQSFFLEYVGTGILKAVDDTQVVPLPAGLPLILGAFAMLGLAGRRRT